MRDIVENRCEYEQGDRNRLVFFPGILYLKGITHDHECSITQPTLSKDTEIDPDKRWIRTWNDYLQRLKYFFRRLYNKREREVKGLEVQPQSDWITPPFIQITEKRTKRISPYLESDLWERDEILTIIKYEPYKRNKAAIDSCRN
jgi:hypothetical protein